MSRSIHVLYRMFDRDGALLYIGMTDDPDTRWTFHEQFTLWWGDVAEIKLQHFATRWELEVAEKAAILAEVPLHNVNSNHRWHTKYRPTPLTQVARDVVEKLGERAERVHIRKKASRHYRGTLCGAPAALTDIHWAAARSAKNRVVVDCPRCIAIRLADPKVVVA